MSAFSAAYVFARMLLLSHSLYDQNMNREQGVQFFSVIDFVRI
jgi:hypothetical protein